MMESQIALPPGYSAVVIKPIGAPRQNRYDRWKQRPAVMRYRDFCDELRSQVEVPSDPYGLGIRFLIPMPKSWSKKKRFAKSFTKHQQRPDIDNLVKAFLDALLPEDSGIAELHTHKHWSGTDDTTGRILYKFLMYPTVD